MKILHSLLFLCFLMVFVFLRKSKLYLSLWYNSIYHLMNLKILKSIFSMKHHFLCSSCCFQSLGIILSSSFPINFLEGKKSGLYSYFIPQSTCTNRLVLKSIYNTLVWIRGKRCYSHLSSLQLWRTQRYREGENVVETRNCTIWAVLKIGRLLDSN